MGKSKKKKRAKKSGRRKRQLKKTGPSAQTRTVRAGIKFDCPHCELPVTITHDDDDHPVALHDDPHCEVFSKLGRDDYVPWMRRSIGTDKTGVSDGSEVKIDSDFFVESISVLRQLRDQVSERKDMLEEWAKEMEDFARRFGVAVVEQSAPGGMIVEEARIIGKVCTVLIPLLETGTTPDIKIQCSPKLLPQLKLMRDGFLHEEQLH